MARQPADKRTLPERYPEATRIPYHVGVIMDGNGRWARARGLPRVAGHKAGVGPVRSTVETCARLGIGVLTLYAFSVENWKRPRAEVETLWRLLRFYLGLFALPALAMLLLASWLRSYVPIRQPARIRDVTWLPPAAR